MLPALEEFKFFDDCQPSLVNEHAGHFAVVCGRRLLGVHPSLDAALQAASEAFSDGQFEDGTSILINEIGATPRVKVVAKPSRTSR